MRVFSWRGWGLLVVILGATLSSAALAVGGEDLPRPVARWTLDEVRGHSIADAVGKLSGTVRGTLQAVPGVEGQALRFDGACVSVPAAPALWFDAAAFSVTAWVNPYTPSGDQQMIVAKNHYAAGQREWGLMLDKDKRFRFYFWQKGWKTVGSQTEPQPGHWHHVAVTVDKGYGRLYVNGKLEGEGSLGPSLTATDAPLSIGGVREDDVSRQTFLGALDEVALYREVLTAAAIRQLADRPTTPHKVEVVEPVKLWDGGSLPKSDDIPVLQGVTFHVIKPHEPAVDGGNWLLGVALAWHNDRLYASYGFNKGAENTPGEEAHGRASSDGGKTWGDVFVIDRGQGDPVRLPSSSSRLPLAEEPESRRVSGGPGRSGSGEYSVPGALGVSHGVFLSHRGTLWAFHGAFYDKFQRTHTRAYVLDEATGKWLPKGVVIGEGFWPLQEPLRMADGNWIMAGARVARGYDVVGNLPAVAISHGEDFTRWDLVVVGSHASVPANSIWGESTVIVDGARILNVSRWGRPIALAAESAHCGRTWTPAMATNLPMAASKPYCGTLSTGQNYLICTTTADSGNRRSPLTIVVSRPGEKTFSRVFVIRHAVFPEGPGPSNANASLCYPYAIEHGGKLYVGYSVKNYRTAEMAVIPLERLR